MKYCPDRKILIALSCYIDISSLLGRFWENRTREEWITKDKFKNNLYYEIKIKRESKNRKCLITTVWSCIEQQNVNPVWGEKYIFRWCHLKSVKLFFKKKKNYAYLRQTNKFNFENMKRIITNQIKKRKHEISIYRDL